jgi:hypothetical protein
MTEDILMKTLAKNGLQRFDPAENNDMFDPNRHEATFQTPQPDKKDGSVFFTQSKGFLYNGRVIRVSTSISPSTFTRELFVFAKPRHRQSEAIDSPCVFLIKIH